MAEQENKKRRRAARKGVETVERRAKRHKDEDLQSRRERENFGPVRGAKRSVIMDLMSQEKCNFNYEYRGQVWSQIGNCHNEERDLVDIARITP